MFDGFLNESIIKKAINNKKINISVVNFRNFSKDKAKKVDDYQYGGGGGMVLTIQPIIDCLKKIKTNKSHIILLSPQGETLNNVKVKKLAKYKELILVCGHYEGFDERINNYVNETISIGDYILTGGEIPAMVIIDTCARMVDNVIKKESLVSETFESNLLDYPVYSKPIEFEGLKVPEVLISGNHKLINEFRKQEQIKKTKLIRPDLYNKYKKQKGENYGKT